MFSQSHIIKLTVVLYKVSDFFPDKEPLKVLIRKKADEVLAGLILLGKNNNLATQVLGDIEVMKAYIELAENLAWLKKENFEVLKKEYCLIGEGLRVAVPEKLLKSNFNNKSVEVKLQQQEVSLSNLSLRHSKIVDILKKGKPIQVKDLKDVFPDVSKRTLRRDFEYLLNKGLVERIGDNNNTEYKLKNR
ncbi:MAG: DeoR family transcriptional regulator [Patescibacteria group bacterium]